MAKSKDVLVEEAHVLLHPMRFRIVKLLTERQMHVSELSKVLQEERRLVSYHLETLEKYGFVKSKYELSEEKKSKGKALKIYWITGKVQEVMSGLKTI